MSKKKSEKKLTIKDPIPQETLGALRQLGDAKIRIAEGLLDLETQKIGFLAGAKRIEEQKSRIFGEILTSRGLSPSSTVQIDRDTGAIKVLSTGPHVQEKPPEEETAEKPES